MDELEHVRQRMRTLLATAAGALGAMAVFAIVGPDDPNLWWELPIAGALAFGAALFLTQRPLSEQLAYIRDRDRFNALEKARTLIDQVTEICKHATNWPNPVRNAINEIISHSRNIVEDLERQYDAAKIQELISYLEALPEALTGYDDATNGRLTFRAGERQQFLTDVGDNLIQSAKGFSELNASVDDSRVTLAQAKAALVRNQQLFSGRLKVEGE